MPPETDIESTPRFRGHHLMCLRHFDGAGCAEPFRMRLAEMSGALEVGHGFVAEGPDDLCLVCPDYSVDADACIHPSCDEFCVRALDALACQLLQVRPGQTFTAAELMPRATAVVDAWVEGACGTCIWARDCRIAPPAC